MDYEAARRVWGEAAAGEQKWASQPSVNRVLRWREIERRLEGVRTILDVGGGTGAFSIPLARRGFEVTHLDLSPAMLAIARDQGAGLPNLKLLEGNAIDLSRLRDRTFDLVLDMDGPISHSGAGAERVIRESCRVSARTVILTAAHAAFVIAAELRGEPLGGLRGFTPAELRRMVEQAGFTVLRAGAIGSLVTLCGKEHVEALTADAARFEAFVDRCEAFEREIVTDGPGSPDDTGLLLVAQR